MAKGRDEHEEKVRLLNSFGKDLARRARSKCELCEEGGKKLAVFVVPPESRIPRMDRCLLLCSDCLEQSRDPKKFSAGEHWRVLAKTVWSEVPMVQVMAARLLRRLSGSQVWARESLDSLYLS